MQQIEERQTPPALDADQGQAPDTEAFNAAAGLKRTTRVCAISLLSPSLTRLGVIAPLVSTNLCVNKASALIVEGEIKRYLQAARARRGVTSV